MTFKIDEKITPYCSFFCITNHKEIEWLTGRIFAGNLKPPECVLLIFSLQSPEGARNFLEESYKGYTFAWHLVRDNSHNLFELPRKAEELKNHFGKEIIYAVYCFKS